VVRPIPNRAEVVLRPIAAAEPGPAEGWSQLRVEVLDVKPVHGWPDLLSGWKGRALTAVVPDAALREAGDEDPWEVEAALAGPATLRVLPPRVRE
jgi:hypothetical protein